MRNTIPVLMLVCLMIPGSAVGQEDLASDSSRPAPQSDDLGEKAASPLGFLPSVAFKNTMDFGAPNGSACFLNIMPLFPFSLGSWDVINRPIIPIINVSGFIEGTANVPQGVPGDGERPPFTALERAGPWFRI